MQYAINDDPATILGGHQEEKDEAYRLFSTWLRDPSMTLVSHGGMFDLARLINLDTYFKPGGHSPDDLILTIISMCLNGRIRDTFIMGKLNAIMYGWLTFDRKMWCRPAFTLAYLAKRFCNITMTGKDGDDAWRMNYHKLDGIPHWEWPDEARQYALDDINHLRPTFTALAENSYADEKFQTAGYWVFRLMEIWGLHTSKEKVEALKAKVIPYINKAHEQLIDHGLMRPGEFKFETERFEQYVKALCESKGIPVELTPSGRVKRDAKFLGKLGTPLVFDKKHWSVQGDPVRNMREIKTRLVNWYVDNNKPVPMVDRKPKDEDYDYFSGAPDEDAEDIEVADITEGVSTDREALSSTTDPNLKLLGEIGKLKTLAGTFIPKMEEGYENPLRPYWNPLVVTGRPSCIAGEFGTNLLNQPREVRKGEAGVRECYQARPGYVFIDGDAVQAELCGLSQICIDKFGYSRMGEIIKSGRDLHAWVGAALFDREYEEVVEGCALYKKMQGGDPKYKWAADARQMAKPCNFGYPGGLGAKKFVKWARKTYEVLFTEAQVKQNKRAWLGMFPEIEDYFQWVNDQIDATGTGKFTYIQHRSLRARGDCGFCDGANTGFQGIIADGVKNAMIKIFIACHTPGDDLYGCRLNAQIYDEMLLEAPIRTAARAARRFKNLFEEGINEYLPDVPAVVEVEMMFNWSKLAKSKTDKDGWLMPFDCTEEAWKQLLEQAATS